MMKTNKHHVLTAMACLLLMALAGGTLFVRTMAAAYSNACEPLAGVPGLLQAVGFLPTGNCKFNEEKECQHHLCVVNGKKGRCMAILISKKHYCICETKPISR